MAVRKVAGLFACGLLALASACAPPPDPEMAELRGKAVEAVRSRFDARGDVFLLDRVKDFRLVRIHARAGGEGRGALKATCWFDARGRLVSVVYAD